MGLGSELCRQIESYGYHVMSIQLKALNNRSEIVGVFEYGKFNSKKNAWIKIGSLPFFWNGFAHIINTGNVEAWQNIHLNNEGVVMMAKSRSTCLWSIEKGMEEISEFLGVSFNDTCVILGNMTQFSTRYSEGYELIPALWKNGAKVPLTHLLGIKDLDNINPPYADSFAIERIWGFSKINNKGQILCEGKTWEEHHPCVLSPTR